MHRAGSPRQCTGPDTVDVRVLPPHRLRHHQRRGHPNRTSDPTPHDLVHATGGASYAVASCAGPRRCAVPARCRHCRRAHQRQARPGALRRRPHHLHPAQGDGRQAACLGSSAHLRPHTSQPRHPPRRPPRHLPLSVVPHDPRRAVERVVRVRAVGTLPRLGALRLPQVGPQRHARRRSRSHCRAPALLHTGRCVQGHCVSSPNTALLRTQAQERRRTVRRAVGARGGQGRRCIGHDAQLAIAHRQAQRDVCTRLSPGRPRHTLPPPPSTGWPSAASPHGGQGSQGPCQDTAGCERAVSPRRRA
mmetsp:Transcript_46938/g.110505  ORF Transcript_46938/g.110505 Transcript_46938/m.110505 type:complete len:304 (+) Transcript_46938:328-1239(+)